MIRIAILSAAACAGLLFARSACATDWALRHLGGPDSLAWELVGSKALMTDRVIDQEALRACPKGYQSDRGVGFTSPDGKKQWRFSFFCLDPAS